MNAAGQVLLEMILITTLVFILIAGAIRFIPNTFSEATPYLGATLQGRIETGRGFSLIGDGNWNPPINSKGGMRNP